MFRDETAAVGLPMRMVVLTIVGMAGLAAMVTFIGDVNLVPKTMHADITGIDSSTTSSVLHVDNGIKNVNIRVIDVDGRPVVGATVVIYGLHASASGVTDSNGNALVNIDTSSIIVSGEGYLKLSAKASGFVNYQNDFALKVVDS
ncbi:MAG TPA: carboxypeptidase regulatory-like domain-containing protein [Methanosarcinales archaeon]|nr:carboxypeptidase regulatory-like domain-containing protein [Methanosarcinales archaeon]